MGTGGTGKTGTLFMLVAGHGHQSRDQNSLGGRYITIEGTLTALRTRAAKFKSAADAKAFANHREIRLGDHLRIRKRKQF